MGNTRVWKPYTRMHQNVCGCYVSGPLCTLGQGSPSTIHRIKTCDWGSRATDAEGNIQPLHATSRMSCVTSVTRKDIANMCVRAVFVSATHHLRQLTQRRANNLVHYLACFWVDVCESRSVYCRGWRPIACVYLLTKVHRKLWQID